MKFIWL